MKDRTKDWLKKGLIGGIAAVLVQILFLASLFFIPSSSLTKMMFPTFLGIRSELKEALKIGASLLWGQLDLFHSHPAGNTDLKVLSVKMGPAEYRLLLGPIDDWKKAGVKTPDLQDWIGADFFYNGRHWPVKIKLAGKRLEHWTESRKSLAVKFPKDSLFQGQKEIRLYPPYYKGGIVTGELLNRLARKMGLIAPRSEYVVLNFNGVDQGVYFLVEEYRGEMLAWNDRPDDSPMYDLEKGTFHLFGHSIVDGGLRRRGNFSPTGKDVAGPIGAMADQRMADCLDWAFNSPEKDLVSKAGDCLDLEKFAAFEAIRSLYQDEHGKIGSGRLYFNPTNGKVEPVLWDAYIPVDWLASSPEAGVSSMRYPLMEPYDFNQFLRDPDVHLMYNRALYELTENGDILKTYDEIRDKVRHEYLSSPVRKIEARIGYLSRKELDHPRIFLETNIQNIRNTLEGGNLEQGVFVLVLDNTGKKTVQLDLEILTVSELALTQVDVPFPCKGQAPSFRARLMADTNNNRSLDGGDLPLSEVSCEKDTLSFRGLNRRFFSRRDADFELELTRATLFVTWNGSAASPRAPELEKTRLYFTNLVTQNPLQSPLFVKAITHVDLKGYRSSALPAFIRFDGERITFLPGEHFLGQTIALPKGIDVTIPSGTRLQMGPGVSLLIRGDLNIRGTQDRPVVVESRDPQRPFGVLAVLGADAVVDHLTIQNGHEAYLDGVFFIGQMDVYHGNLTITNSIIGRSKSDDGLNVKYGRVKISGNRFHDNSFDALDLDYCSGEVSKNVFENTGTPDGDGIDLSGSNVMIRENKISGFGDKGISIGEKSTPLVFDNLIEGNNVGVAIKDLSEARIYSSTIVGNKTGISLFRKKPTFGGGVGRIANSILANAKDIEIDDLSRLQAAVSTSLTEESFGFKRVKPNLKDPFFSAGGDPEYIQDFVSIRRNKYPVGSLSYHADGLQ